MLHPAEVAGFVLWFISLVAIRADWRPITSLPVVLALVTAVAAGWSVFLVHEESVIPRG